MALNDVFEVAFATHQNDQKCINVLHAQQNSGGTPTPEIDLGVALNASFLPAYLNCCNHLVSASGYRIRRIRPTAGGTYLPTATGNGGISSVESLPPNACCRITLYTDYVGASGRGSIHLSGVSVTNTEDGVINAAQLALYDSLGSAMTFNIGAFHLGLLDPITFAWRNFTGFRTNSRVLTLRSRRVSSLI